jgi:hypothetical protein
VFGDPRSVGYETFRANMAEYAALLPPNSHGEANPADKDPVPPPFDNTYNSPEHDAFVMNVKYQRNDRFFTDNIVDGADRARLNQAWNDSSMRRHRLSTAPTRACHLRRKTEPLLLCRSTLPQKRATKCWHRPTITRMV